jgi:hypothetical protein
MTVAELIKDLQKQDQDLEVVFDSGQGMITVRGVQVLPKCAPSSFRSGEECLEVYEWPTNDDRQRLWKNLDKGRYTNNL